MKHRVSRRSFIRGMAAAGLSVVMPGITQICTASCQGGLSFYHTHTGECLDIQYPFTKASLRDEMEKLNYFLRDFRTGDVHEIDPGLLDILYHIKTETGGSIFEVISGYRSPATNAMLRKRSRGVARKSLHLKGKAIDIRLKGVNTMTVRNCALALRRGGVGYYRKSDFVHVDTGRFRVW